MLFPICSICSHSAVATKAGWHDAAHGLNGQKNLWPKSRCNWAPVVISREAISQWHHVINHAQYIYIYSIYIYIL